MAHGRGTATWLVVCGLCAAAPAATGGWIHGASGPALAASAGALWVGTGLLVGLGSRFIRAPLRSADLVLADGTPVSSGRALHAQSATGAAGIGWIGLALCGVGAAIAHGWFALALANTASLAVGWLLLRSGWRGHRYTRAIRLLNLGDAESALLVAGDTADDLFRAEVALRAGDGPGALAWLTRAPSGTLRQVQVRQAEIRLALGDLAVARAVLAGPPAADPVSSLNREALLGRLLLAEGRGAEIPSHEAHWRALSATLPAVYSDGLVLLRVAGHEAANDPARAVVALGELSLPLGRYSWWGLVWPDVWARVARIAGNAAPPVPPRAKPIEVADLGPFAPPVVDPVARPSVGRVGAEGIAPVGIASVWTPRSRGGLLRSLLGATSLLSLGFLLPPLLLLGADDLGIAPGWVALCALVPFGLVPAIAAGAWLAWVPDRRTQGTQLVLDSSRRIAARDFASWRFAQSVTRGSAGLLLVGLGFVGLQQGAAWAVALVTAILLLAAIGTAKQRRNARLAWSAHTDAPDIWADRAIRAVGGLASLAADRDGARAWLTLARLFEGDPAAARAALSEAETRSAEIALLDGWLALAEGRADAVRALAAAPPAPRESERYLHAVFLALLDLADDRAAAVVARAPELRLLADRHANRFGHLLSALVGIAEGRDPPAFLLSNWPFLARPSRQGSERS